MKIDLIEDMITEIKANRKKAKELQSKKDKLEGEKLHLIETKKELDKKAQDEFGMSIEELKIKIEEWTKELSTEMATIKKMIAGENE